MSLILDALRKSDVERSRQHAPQIAGAAAAATPRPERRWLLPVLGLLAVNAVLLAWVLLRPGGGAIDAPGEPPDVATAETAPSRVSGVTPAQTAAASTQAPVSAPPPKARVESLVGETIVREPAAAVAETAAPVPGDLDRAREAAAPSVAVAEPAPRQAAAQAPAPEPTAGLADAMTLADDGVIARETLTMELHYYADAPERRFAFIGGRRVGEGDALSAGVRVVEVVRNGVVLEYRGGRYLLRRN